MSEKLRLWLKPAAAVVLFVGLGLALMGQGPVVSRGQMLYVPVYSHIYWGTRGRTFNLACTLSIRNTDPSAPITVTSVDYFDTEGKRIRAYLERPLSLGPLATKEYYIEEEDTRGGSGANFIVRWSAEAPVNAPIVECVMIGVRSGQGVSFTSRAQEIVDTKK